MNFQSFFSSPLLCVSLKAYDDISLFQQIQQAKKWTHLIEIRLDLLDFLDFQTLREIKQQTASQFIWTLRKASQGGRFAGSEQQKAMILQALLETIEVDFMDLEGDTPVSIVKNLQLSYPSVKWIISHHDQNETPGDLLSIYQMLQQHSATYYKIAAFAKTTSDALRMLNFTREQNQKTSQLCGLCMGEKGQLTRILSPLANQPFTFAALEKGKETAEGQLTAEELTQHYRFHRINQETELLGLIGNPVDKSLSHLTHNAVLDKLAINACYLKFALQADELPHFFEQIKPLPFRGLSVTMPFKEKILNWIDKDHELTSCNTLIFSAEGLKGANTDGTGTLKALGYPSFEKKKIVILGAGGTAKAIAKAAFQRGAEIAILNRTVEKAKEIAEPLQARWGSLDLLPALIEEGYRCVIQGTSVGMSPLDKETLIPVEWLSKDVHLLEVVSQPLETLLLKKFRLKGGRTTSGRELFIHQAVQQFIHWYGKNMSEEIIENAIRQALSPGLTDQVVTIYPGALKGSLSLPPSKSHTIRAILLAALAKGTSYIHHLLESPDKECALEAARQLGAKIEQTLTGLAITGVAGYPQTPADVIDAGNSGQVLRFVGALAALAPGYTVITGDASIRSNRPISPLIKGLNELQAWAVSTRDNGYAPLIVKGPLQPGKTSLEGQDSQPVSALLMAASFVEGETQIEVKHAGEKPWLSLTLSWLDRLGVIYTHQNYEKFTIQGQRVRPCFEVTLPGDLSALAFPLIAALITGSSIIIQNVNMQDIQGDKEIVYLLQQMGACLKIDETNQTLEVLKSEKIEGRVIDVNAFIDAVPILAVLGCYAEGETQLVNASIARHKESDRLACITSELSKMGAFIEETEDGLIVKKSNLKGTLVHSHHDHRLAMALIVAGLIAEGETQVRDIGCINKSYSSFIQDFCKIGALISPHLH